MHRGLDSLNLVSIGVGVDGVGREVFEKLVSQLVDRQAGCNYVSGGH